MVDTVDRRAGCAIDTKRSCIETITQTEMVWLLLARGGCCLVCSRQNLIVVIVVLSDTRTTRTAGHCLQMMTRLGHFVHETNIPHVAATWMVGLVRLGTECSHVLGRLATTTTENELVLKRVLADVHALLAAWMAMATTRH